MEATRSSETSVLTTPTRRRIQESGILHSHCLESLKSYICPLGGMFLNFSVALSPKKMKMRCLIAELQNLGQSDSTGLGYSKFDKRGLIVALFQLSAVGLVSFLSADLASKNDK
jgi:hypothetical protein